MGLTSQQIHQPLIGVATAWNEAAPCNISLQRQAQAVKRASPRHAVRRANSPPHGDRRHGDGPRRYEVLARQPRRHRRLGELTMRAQYDALVAMPAATRVSPA